MTVSRLFDLSGKAALITGSSDGLGLAMARGLAAAGARIVLNGRDEKKLAGAAKSIADAGMRSKRAPSTSPTKRRFSPPSSISTPMASRSTSW